MFTALSIQEAPVPEVTYMGWMLSSKMAIYHIRVRFNNITNLTLWPYSFRMSLSNSCIVKFIFLEVTISIK